MTTKTDLINNPKQYVYRHVYIKRRSLLNVYEDNWQRIDFINGFDQVFDFGQTDISIDANPGEIANFDIQTYSISVDNKDGRFNIETDSNSLWYGYLTRKYTKIKIECGYTDFAGDLMTWGAFGWGDGSKWGGTTSSVIFEGVINKVIVDENQIATLQCASYNQVLQKYDISDLSLTGNKTVTQIYDAMMTQSKITMFITYVSPTPKLDNTIDSSLLAGTYYDVLKDIALLSHSVIYIDGSTINFLAKTFMTTSAYDFKGAGNIGNIDIFKVQSFDDEGDDRIRLYWKSTGEARTAINSDATLNAKYLQEPQEIDLSLMTSSVEKDALLASLLDEWDSTKPIITFETKFMLGIVKPLDLVTIDIRGQTRPAKNVFQFGSSIWGDGSVYGSQYGSIKIPSTQTWGIIKISKDIQNWRFVITAQRLT